MERLCLQPRRAQAVSVGLTAPLSELQLGAVCGPLVEGAFVALMLALQLDVQFTYSEKFGHPAAEGLFPAGYRVPASLREGLRGKRVAIVDDVINAGPRSGEHFADLEECGANIVAISTLLALGSVAAKFAASKNVPLYNVATLPSNLWTASEVCFRWKDYAHGGKQRTMTLTPQEFLRRFVQHVLPRGFPRIRYFGWLSNRMRRRILPICRALLNQAPSAEAPVTAKQVSRNCTHCQGLMQPVEKLSAAQLFFTQRNEVHVLDSS